MPPVPLAALVTVNPERSAADEASITRSWDVLAGMLTEDQLTESQFAWIVRHSPDDDADPFARNMWARALRRYVAKPGDIGVDYDAFRTYACTCLDTGWVSEWDDEYHHSWVSKPCKRCNHRQYERFLDHWRDPDHSCSECSGPTGKRATLTEERDDQTRDRQQDLMDDLA